MNLKAYLHLFLIIVGMNISAHAEGTKSTLASSNTIDMLLIQADIVVLVEVQSIQSIGKSTFDIFRYGRLVALKPSVVYASNSKKMAREIYLFQKGAVQGLGETPFNVGEEYIVFLKATPPPYPVSEDMETVPALPQSPYYSVLKRRNTVVSKQDEDAFSRLHASLRAKKYPSELVPVNSTNSAPKTEAATSMPKRALPERISQLLEMGHSESYEAVEEMVRKSGIDDIVGDFDKALDADLETDEKEHLVSVLCNTQLPEHLHVEYDDFIDNEALVSLLISVYEKEQVTRSDILPYLLLTKKGAFPDSFESFLIDAYKKEPGNKNHGLLLGHCGGEKALRVSSEKQNSNNSRISFLAKVASAKLGDEKAEEEIIEAYRETVNDEQTEFRAPKLGQLRFALSYIDSVETKLAFCDSVSSPIEYKTARDVLAADPWQNAWNAIKRCAEETGIQVPSIWDQKKAIKWWTANRARVKQRLEKAHKEGMSRGGFRYIDRLWKNID